MSWPKERCGCCEGTEKLTPKQIFNRPGLDALDYRVGTHATFLETMLARLSEHRLEPGEADGAGPGSSPSRPLQGLKTRVPDDPAIAMLDCWSTVADVLAFYQERVANEGFLRTATERRSVQELARLVGYKPRPGVAASVYLAYTLDDNFEGEMVIPRGTRSQSVPGPGELPQSFETSEDLKARPGWNALKPRTLKPQNITLDNALTVESVFLKGAIATLKPNDPLLLVFGDGPGEKVLRRVRESRPDFQGDVTQVLLRETPPLIGVLVDLLRMITDQKHG